MKLRHLKLCIFTVSVVCLLGYRILTDTERLNCTRNLTPVKTVGASEGIFVGPHDVLARIRKNNIKEIPLWMLEEVYLRDSQPKEMICRHSLRNSEDTEFKEAFIPDIQLFLHRDHINISEWNRLVHFNNPFGFMGYKYTEVKNIVDLILKPKEFPLLAAPSTDKQGCVRCAVVANGGILNGSKMGQTIDSHDYVFRMDGAVIEGHEEDVGIRTSVFVHTASTLMASLDMIQELGFRDVPTDEGISYVLVPVGLGDLHFLKTLLLKTSDLWKAYKNMWQRYYFLDNFDENKYYVLHPDFLRYIRNRYLKSWHLNEKSWKMFRPTSGAFSLFLAVHTCDIVNAYGFLTTNHRKFAETYFKKTDSGVDYLHYDYNLELELLERLHNSKVINLYKRQ
ncbi:alpha-N-acetylgalactosaminide alpha-2,6-sialyltransferase 1-like [Anguilla rostrata]|uniref:alpha-N-acetylgalactosaminide alpha-2,6-sialyltransferase 1-like n=1 Tax=Anguilla rostrata TaxID=7938 RepID=UPI0030D5A13D